MQAEKLGWVQSSDRNRISTPTPPAYSAESQALAVPARVTSQSDRLCPMPSQSAWSTSRSLCLKRKARPNAGTWGLSEPPAESVWNRNCVVFKCSTQYPEPPDPVYWARTSVGWLGSTAAAALAIRTVSEASTAWKGLSSSCKHWRRNCHTYI